MHDEIRLRTHRARRLATKHAAATIERMGPVINSGISEVYSYVTSHGLQPAGPPMVAFPEEPLPGQVVDFDICVPVEGSGPDGDGIEIRAAEPEQVATTLHRGRYEDAGDTYADLYAWIEQHGYTAAGAPREIYLTNPDSTPDPDDYLTEIEVPVRT